MGSGWVIVARNTIKKPEETSDVLSRQGLDCMAPWAVGSSQSSAGIFFECAPVGSEKGAL